LQPNVSANDPNELKPNVTDNGGQIPPPQVNEIQTGATDQGSSFGQAAATGTKTGDQASSSSQQKEDVDAAIASSKHKKKKGLKKIVPF
jgi:hypothetical protein